MNVHQLAAACATNADVHDALFAVYGAWSRHRAPGRTQQVLAERAAAHASLAAQWRARTPAIPHPEPAPLGALAGARDRLHGVPDDEPRLVALAANADVLVPRYEQLAAAVDERVDAPTAALIAASLAVCHADRRASGCV